MFGVDSPNRSLRWGWFELGGFSDCDQSTFGVDLRVTALCWRRDFVGKVHVLRMQSQFVLPQTLSGER